MSREEAARRMAMQNSQADKLRQADVVIENDGDIEGAARAGRAGLGGFHHRDTDRLTTESTEIFSLPPSSPRILSTLRNAWRTAGIGSIAGDSQSRPYKDFSVFSVPLW